MLNSKGQVIKNIKMAETYDEKIGYLYEKISLSKRITATDEDHISKIIYSISDNSIKNIDTYKKLVDIYYSFLLEKNKTRYYTYSSNSKNTYYITLESFLYNFENMVINEKNKYNYCTEFKRAYTDINARIKVNNKNTAMLIPIKEELCLHFIKFLNNYFDTIFDLPYASTNLDFVKKFLMDNADLISLTSINESKLQILFPEGLIDNNGIVISKPLHYDKYGKFYKDLVSSSNLQTFFTYLMMISKEDFLEVSDTIMVNLFKAFSIRKKKFTDNKEFLLNNNDIVNKEVIKIFVNMVGKNLLIYDNEFYTKMVYSFLKAYGIDCLLDVPNMSRRLKVLIFESKLKA